jgi:3-phenylpropionate/trans-cinnamate dioxygenase ferredoxin reductase subunit
VWDVTGPIQELIRSRRPIDATRLGDAQVALEELVAGERGLEPVA